MRRYMVLLCLIAVTFLMGCALNRPAPPGGQGGTEDEEWAFIAVVQELGEHSLLVEADSETAGFDLARVSLRDCEPLDFEPEVGQTLCITCTGGIQESYPVGVSAVRIARSVDAEE